MQKLPRLCRAPQAELCWLFRACFCRETRDVRRSQDKKELLEAQVMHRYAAFLHVCFARAGQNSDATE